MANMVIVCAVKYVGWCCVLATVAHTGLHAWHVRATTHSAMHHSRTWKSCPEHLQAALMPWDRSRFGFQVVLVPELVHSSHCAHGL